MLLYTTLLHTNVRHHMCANASHVAISAHTMVWLPVMCSAVIMLASLMHNIAHHAMANMISPSQSIIGGSGDVAMRPHWAESLEDADGE